MEIITMSSGLALAFGALHALEPGHGKTALLTYIASGKKTWKDGLVISITSSITHSLAVFLIAYVSHHLLHHHTAGEADHGVHNFLGYVSGGLIFGIGLWTIFKRHKPHSCSACDGHHHDHNHGHSHGKQGFKLASKRSFLTSGLLGVATGIMPCPTVVAAYLSGLSSGNSIVAIQSVVLFAIGMFISLMMVIVFFSMGGEKIAEKLKGSVSFKKWNIVQGTVFMVIGVFTAFIH